MPGIRDQHTGCVGAYLVEHDLFDFLLFSLPDNDAWSHKNGPHAQVTSIAAADRQLERLMHAAGGPEAFLDEHAVIVTSDHSQAAVEERIRLDQAFEDFEIATPGSGSRSGAARPRSRSVPRSARRWSMRSTPTSARRWSPGRSPRLASSTGSIWCSVWGRSEGSTDSTHSTPEAVVSSARGELRFAPGGEFLDLRGYLWSVDGELAALGAEIQDGRFLSPEYPDALARVWSALNCETAGDVLLSAQPGYEFVDWGGADHVGGGSHGSLHRSDSLGALLWCGTGPGSREAREQWSLRDVTPMISDHFGVGSVRSSD